MYFVYESKVIIISLQNVAQNPNIILWWHLSSCHLALMCCHRSGMAGPARETEVQASWSEVMALSAWGEIVCLSRGQNYVPSHMSVCFARLSSLPSLQVCGGVFEGMTERM